MTIEFNCPNCEKLLRTSDDKAGRRAKCPDCGTAVTVPQPRAPQIEDDFDDEPGPDQETFDRVPPRRVASGGSDTKTCPVCGGTIKAAALRCRHCGEDLGGGPRSGTGAPTTIDPGEVISTSWEIYKSQMGMLIGAMFLVGIVNGAAGLPSNILGQFAGGQQGNNNMAPLFMGLSIVFTFLSWVVQIYLAAGHCIFTLKIARGEPVEIADIFRGGPYLLRALGNSLLYSLIVGAAMLVCLVPALIVIATSGPGSLFGWTMGLGILAGLVPAIIFMLMLWPFMFVLVDSDAPGIECLTRSREITANNWGAGFVLGLTYFGLSVLGLLACCIGLIFTMPLATFMFAVAYCRMTGQATARV